MSLNQRPQGAASGQSPADPRLPEPWDAVRYHRERQPIRGDL